MLNWMLRPLNESLTTVITSDPQPPLAYALFWGWGQLFGTSETTTRLLPALLNLTGTAALFALGRRIGGWRGGLLAALLWALHPYQIWHAQDARNYAIWSAASATALWLALVALGRQRRIDWVLYILAASISAYLYYLELFTLFVLNLFVLLTRWREWQLLRQWFATQIVIGAVLAVWFLQPRLLSGGGYSGTTGGFDPLQWLTRFLPALNFGETLPTATASVAAVLLPPLLTAGALFLWRRQRRMTILLALLATVPLLLLGIVSLRLNVFTPRYVFAAAPAYILLYVALLLALLDSRRQLLRRAAPVLLAGWLLTAGLSLYAYGTGTPKAPNWRGVTEYLYENVAPAERVILTSSDLAFTYYFPTPFDYLPASPTQSASEIQAELTSARANYASLWLVGEPWADWQNAGVVPEWLAANMQRVRHMRFGQLPVREYRRWEVADVELAGDTLAVFDQTAELEQVRVFQEPDNRLTIWLYWRPIAVTERPLKVFVHLLGNLNPAASTPLWAQDDRFPQDGRISTTGWQSQMVYRDVYEISLEGVAPGDYALVVGWYDPETNQRVTINGGDSYTIASITHPAP